MATYQTEDSRYLQAAPAYRADGPEAWLIRLPVLFITGLILLAIIMAILVGAFRYRYTDKITPGVSALGVDLSGMTAAEAAAALDTQFVYDENIVFTFTYDDWPELADVFAGHGDLLQRSAGELGLAFDLQGTVDAALAVGAEDELFTELREQALTWLNGEAVAPVIRYDQDVALAHLTALAALIDKDPTAYNARLDSSGTGVELGEHGRRLNVAATLTTLNDRITNLENGGAVPLVIERVDPPTTVANAQEASNLFALALSGPIELTADDPLTGRVLGPWTINVEQIESLLSTALITEADGTTRYEVRVDMEPFRESLASLAPGLIVRPRNARFHFDDATRELQVIQPAINGREMNVEETLARLESAVFRADNRSVPIAFNFTTPRYHDGITAAELGITGMVAEATTLYTGSEPNRRHNIAEGASRFDGIIIGPGEEFSFNYWLGELSEQTGFVEGKVIVGGRTVGGIGGGICQVSTTIFRAAFNGGFSIIERNSHAYRVGYYELNAPPGLDAAIWTPERDFRFQNDTDYHLLIETSIYPNENELQFRFYSTNPGRVVRIEEPSVRNVEPAPPVGYEANRELQPGQVVQVDYAAEGADVNVVRIITDMQGNEITRDNIFTHYLPWQAIYQVHPNDTRLGGTQ